MSSSDEVGAICGEYILEGKLGEAEDAAFGNVTVGVVGAKGAKCERCWNYSVCISVLIHTVLSLKSSIHAHRFELEMHVRVSVAALRDVLNSKMTELDSR